MPTFSSSADIRRARSMRPERIVARPAFQRRIGTVEGKPQNVDLQRLPLDRDFHAVDKRHAHGVCSRTRRRQAVKVIVVGQRQHLHTVRGRTTGNFGRGQETVRTGGMAVEIAVEHGYEPVWAAEVTAHDNEYG
jgi:hypothetical protein